MDEKTAKAFGGCTKCYGKGYTSVTTDGTKEYNPCNCDRGKQFMEMRIKLRDAAEMDTLKYLRIQLQDYLQGIKVTKTRANANLHIKKFIEWAIENA